MASNGWLFGLGTTLFFTQIYMNESKWRQDTRFGTYIKKTVETQQLSCI